MQEEIDFPGVIRLGKDPSFKQDRDQCIYLEGLKLLSIDFAVNNFRWPDHKFITFSSPASPIPERLVNTQCLNKTKHLD